MSSNERIYSILVLLILASAVLSVNAGQGESKGQSEIQQGLDIAPVPLDLAGRNRALVSRGSYIVNAQGDCNGCHTVNFDPYEPGGNPFNGEPERIDPEKYLVGGSAFGPFISRNLRPNPDTGLPADLTLGMFIEVMRQGTDFHDASNPIPGTPILQVMPWPTFGKMTDRDLLAIYEYLSALPPAP